MKLVNKITLAAIGLTVVAGYASASEVDFSRVDALSSPKDRVSITTSGSASLSPDAFNRVDSLRSNRDLNLTSGETAKLSKNTFLQLNGLRSPKDVF